MSKTSTYQITISAPREGGKTSDTVHRLGTDSGKPLGLRAPAGATYTLTDLTTGKAPQQVHARRRGQDLWLQIDDYGTEDSADLILEGYYSQPGGLFVGLAEDEQSYPFIPNTGEAQHQIGAMADGAGITQVLGGSPYAAAPVMGVAAVGAGALVGVGGMGLGAVAAGVLGLAAAAGGGGGGGGGGSTGGGSSQPAVALEAKLKPADDTGASDSDNLTNKTQPAIEGKTTPGNKVFVTLDNGTEQEVPVDPKDGTWTWTPPSALASGERNIKVKALDPKGASNEQTLKLTVDTSPLGVDISHPASLTPALADGKLNIAELGESVPVTLNLSELPNRDLTVDDLSVTGGSIKPGSFQKISATDYAVSVLPPATPTSDNGRIEVSLKTSASPALTDAAGNPLGTVTPKVFLYDNKPPTASITNNQQALENSGDNLLNSVEAANGVRYTLNLDSVPNRNLLAADLLVTGGTLVESSLTKVSDTVYSVLTQVSANTAAGQLQLKLRPATALTDVAGNPLAVTDGPVVNYDTQAIRATISSNRQALERNNDNVLNIAESANGVTFSITLDSAAKRDLTVGDLVAEGGTLQASSFTRLSATSYTAVVQPTAATNGGVLRLKLQPATALTDAAGNPTAAASSADVAYDTKGLSILSITPDSVDANKDSVLNIAELGTAGVKYTLVLDSPAQRDLTAADITATGGTYQSGSLLKISDTQYTADLVPVANQNAGVLKLSVQAGTPALSDGAGNPLAPTSSADLAYDNKAPVASLFAEAIKDLPTNNTAFQIPVNTNDTDLASMRADILGQSKTITRAGSGNTWAFSLTQEGLTPLENGYYTFKLTTTDSAGNSSVTMQVLKMNRGSLLPDSWTASNPVGTSADELFINRAGGQTFDGGGGKDTFVWLARDAATPGTPATDTVLNFTLGASGQGDRLDIRDLLGGVTDFSQLSRFVKISAINTDADPQADSLQLAISRLGGFSGNSNDAAVTDQVIVLKNLLPVPLPTLASLDQINLLWQTTAGTPLLG